LGLQGGVVVEDALFQFLRGWCGLQPGRFDEAAGVVAAGGEGVGLAASAVHGDHQAGAESLVSGVFEYQRSEFADDVDVAELEVGVDASSERAEVFGVEAHDLGLSPGALLEILVGVAAPQQQSVVQLVSCSTGLAALDKRSAAMCALFVRQALRRYLKVS